MAGLLGIGQSALMAAYAQLQTTGHNIANANTPGYSVQDAQFATAGGRYTGGGFLGMGVNLVTVQRRYDRFLAAELASATAAAAADQARSAQLGRLERLFADTDNGIGAAIDDLNAALADVVNRPSDPSAREVVVRRADTLAQRVQSADSSMRELGAGADEQIAQAAGRVNELLDQFATLNERIAQMRGSGHTPNDLLDERDRVMLQLNGYMKVTAHEQDDGTVNLFASGGEGLLVGTRPASLVVGTEPGDASRQRIVLQYGGTGLPMTSASFGGGSIAGLMRFRDEDLAQTRTALSALAQRIAQGYNAQQALGVLADGSPGRPMFAFADGVLARELVSGASLATAYAVAPQVSGTNRGDVTVTQFLVVDASPADLRKPVTISFNGDGTFDVTGDGTGNPTGQTYQTGQPIVFNGWTLTLRGTPQAGDAVEVVPNASPGTDNRNARAMIALSGRPPDGGVAFTDGFAALLADVGARAQSAAASLVASEGLQSNAKAAHTEYTAVNLDEEAARLMQYQQMYQAAAKVIQAAQSMFDTLLSATSR